MKGARVRPAGNVDVEDGRFASSPNKLIISGYSSE